MNRRWTTNMWRIFIKAVQDLNAKIPLSLGLCALSYTLFALFALSRGEVGTVGLLLSGIYLSWLVFYFEKLKNKNNVIPTELIFVNLPFVFLGFQLYITTLPWEAKLVTIIYTLISIVFYWSIYFYFREPGRIQKIFKEQVEDQEKKRISMGVLLAFLDEFHIFISFGSGFVILANFFYKYGVNGSINYWNSLYYIALTSNLLSGFDVPSDLPISTPGKILCGASSVLGLIFETLIITAFLRAYQRVIK